MRGASPDGVQGSGTRSTRWRAHLAPRTRMRAMTTEPEEREEKEEREEREREEEGRVVGAAARRSSRARSRSCSAPRASSACSRSSRCGSPSCGGSCVRSSPHFLLLISPLSFLLFSPPPFLSLRSCRVALSCALTAGCVCDELTPGQVAQEHGRRARRPHDDAPHRHRARRRAARRPPRCRLCRLTTIKTCAAR